MPDCSVIISIYNNFRYLDLVLAGFERQSYSDFEIILADDGSKLEVVNQINELIRKKPFAINHIWHEDLGWRKPIMLNKAVKAAKSEYIIIIDGDCIPHRHFIKEHLRNKELGKILSGRRLNLSKSISDSLTTKQVRQGFLEQKIFKWLIKGLKKDFTHAEKGLYLPFLRKILTIKNKGLLGCNFSFYKSDLSIINGFDERYLAATYGEDTDIEYRAKIAGLKIKSIRNLAVQYHLYHKPLSRENNNHLIFEETVKNKMYYTPYGLIKED